ncbi:hypothetical protein LXL04_000883 [Taraxacum kok-saghyz]
MEIPKKIPHKRPPTGIEHSTLPLVGINQHLYPVNPGFIVVFARNYAGTGTGTAGAEAPKQPPPPLLHLLILSLCFSDRLPFGRRCFFLLQPQLCFFRRCCIEFSTPSRLQRRTS